MTQLLQLAVAMLIGVGAAVQTSMLGAVGRERSPSEAVWLSILGTTIAVTSLVAVRGMRGDSPDLPAPLDRAGFYFGVAALAGIGLVLTMRGLEPYYAVVGLFGLGVILGAAILAPELGVALFLSALIAGQLIGGLTLDQLGAFGGDVHRVNAVRLAGVAALLLGVALVRGGAR